MPSLTVCIPTIVGRERQFNELVRSISGRVPIVMCRDNKEMSIGAKRQLLLEEVKTEYVVFVDDDDALAPDYFETILPLLEQSPDCICYLEDINGKQVAKHSNDFLCWGEGHGYDYVRTPFYKDVLQTSIALEIGFSDMRYGEDEDFSRRLKASGLIKNEIFIDRRMYFYRMPKSMTAQEHSNRYGIK